STSGVQTSYVEIIGQMLVTSGGMGLATAPATEAIMGVVRKEKAGVGAAVNDANRLLGGTLGVAVIGSVFASLYIHAMVSSRAAAVVPPKLFAQSEDSVGAALIGARRLAGSEPGPAGLLVGAAHRAFFEGFRAGCLVAACVALAGAVFVVIALPARPTESLDSELAELVDSDRIDSPVTL
ncbi:MAG TPA: hypothetical protein VIC86_06680, partial [Acidimicrobiales bacterium]